MSAEPSVKQCRLSHRCRSQPNLSVCLGLNPRTWWIGTTTLTARVPRDFKGRRNFPDYVFWRWRKSWRNPCFILWKYSQLRHTSPEQELETDSGKMCSCTSDVFLTIYADSANHLHFRWILQLLIWIHPLLMQLETCWSKSKQLKSFLTLVCVVVRENGHLKSALVRAKQQTTCLYLAYAVAESKSSRSTRSSYEPELVSWWMKSKPDNNLAKRSVTGIEITMTV